MALDFLKNEDEDSILGSSKSTKEEVVQPRGQATITDYASDILWNAPAKGISLLARGLLEFGAIPVDYAFNTDFLSKIENVFTSDGFFKTPETKTWIGDMEAVLVEYGVPSTYLTKLISAAPKLAKLGQFTKLEAIPTLSGKAGEIAKRAGYFGAVGGITDVIASVPGENETLGQQIGLYSSDESKNLTGSDRAEELLKSKIKFGAEGTVLGGAIPLLPVAGTLGVKYGLIAAKPIATVGKGVVEAINNAVVNPISKYVLANERTGIPQLITNTGKVIDTVLEKVGVPRIEEWAVSAKDTRLGGLVLNTLNKTREYLSSAGGFYKVPELDSVKRQFAAQADIKAKRAIDVFTQMDTELKNIITDYKMSFDKNISKNIIQYQQSILQDFWNTPSSIKVPKLNNLGNPILDSSGKEIMVQADREILKALDPKVSSSKVVDSAIQLKKMLGDVQTNLAPSINKKELTSGFMDYVDTSFKQTLGAFNNSRFGFDPLKERKVVDFFKGTIVNDQEFRSFVINKIGKPELEDTFTKIIKKDVNNGMNEFLNINENNLNKFNSKYKTDLDLVTVNNFKKELENQSLNKTVSLKYTAIRNDRSPEQIWKNISETVLGEGNYGLNSLGKIRSEILSEKSKFNLYKDVKNKVDLNSIVEYLSIPKNSTVTINGKVIPLPASDYSSGILSGIIHGNKQLYLKKWYDAFEQLGLEKGLLFKSKNEANAAGKTFDDLTGIPRKPTEEIFESSLTSTGYLTTPEIANAIRGTTELFNGLYDIPGYAGMMKIKAGAQLGGTVFSPLAQVRNVTGNSFIAMVNGLYGGRTSLSDSFKIVAQDIFRGAKTDLKKLNEVFDDLIARNVTDQNIQMTELKKMLQTANRGEISFDTFMNTPLVKKAVDIYAGADNGWKIFGDSFYQNALTDAFKAGDTNLLKAGTKPHAEFMSQAEDWWKNIAKQDFIKHNYITGADKTATETLKEMSAWLTVNTIPTYSKMPKIIQALRDLPFGNYISFPTAILMTGSNIIGIGARELASKNPLIRQMGARRLIGVSAGFGGVGYVVKKSAEALTGVSGETMDAFQRSFSAPYEKNSTLIPLTKPDENGNFKYYNFSYTNPYNTLVQPVNAVLGAFGDGSLNKDTADTIVMNALFGNNVTGRKGALAEFFSPYTDESIGSERILDMTLRGGKKKEGGNVWFKEDDMSTKIAKGIEHLMGGLVPGAVKSAKNVWQGATGTFTNSGTIKDARTELFALMSGVRIEDAKPLASMPFIITSFNKDNQTINQKFSSVVYAPASTMEQRLGAYKDYVLESYASQNSLYRTIQDASLLGMDEKDLKNIVESRLSNKEQTKSLFDGVFKVPSVNDKAFQSLIKRLESESLTGAVKVENEIDTVKSIFKDISRDLRNYDLNSPMGDLKSYLDRLLTPEVKSIRSLPSSRAPLFNTSDVTSSPVNTQQQATYSPPVNSKVIAQYNQPTLGSKYNLIPSGLTATQDAFLKDPLERAYYQQKNLQTKQV